MEEVRQIRRGEVMNGFECCQQDLKVNAEFDREPVELLKNRCDMVDGRRSGDDTGS